MKFEIKESLEKPKHNQNHTEAINELFDSIPF